MILYGYSWRTTGFVTRVTRWAPHGERELLTLLENPSSHPVLAQLVLCNLSFSVWCFVHHCLFFCRFCLPLYNCVLQFTLLSSPLISSYVSSRKHGINSSLIRKHRIASMYMLLHYPILFRDIRALIFCFIVLFLLLLVLYASVSSSKIYTIT